MQFYVFPTELYFTKHFIVLLFMLCKSLLYRHTSEVVKEFKELFTEKILNCLEEFLLSEVVVFFSVATILSDRKWKISCKN